MKHKKVIISIVILAIFSCLIIENIKLKTSLLETENKYVKTKAKSLNHNLAMMLETEANSEKYEMTTRNEWPTSGYKFNSKLSKCENGGSLSWDFANKNVVMEGTTSDKCYIYFDKVVTVSDYCTSGDNLADCIKTFGNEGYDKSSIYIHDESLKNGANDNSYRFAGSSDYVNNYVCFGSNEETCPSDNLYRIIGVFEDQVKLIKADFANSNLLGTDGAYSSETFSASDYSNYKGNLTSISTYYWNNSTNKNTWSESNLNTINLNTNYLNNLGESWANMIDDSLWQVGGNTYANIERAPMYEAYQNEIVSPAESTTYSAKIGLMYVSDYGYAASSKYWTYVGYNSEDSSKDYRVSINENWMYMGIPELTITRRTNDTITAFRINMDGYISYGEVNSNNRPIRPSFYLKSSIKYAEGSGTKENPIKLQNRVTLASYIKNQYTTQGENSIYYHNGTIKSGDTVIDANDGSYRYAGANPNNYVCFGSNEDVCPSDNLYRIIGVFGSQVKIIKADYANSNLLGEDGAYVSSLYYANNYPNYNGNLTTINRYYWNNSTSTNEWSESSLNTINLNKNYLSSLGTFATLIDDTLWQVGGNTYTNIVKSVVYEAYQNEIVLPESATYSAKIGLMYVSDYGYAASSKYWTYKLYDTNGEWNSDETVWSGEDYSKVINDNWMYAGVFDWTITRRTETTNRAFYVSKIGYVLSRNVNYADDDCYSAIRPVFYLKSSVVYTGDGDGTKIKPIKVE